MDLRTGVGNSELRATFAHGRGCLRKLSALRRGAAGHFRAQAWAKANIPFSWVGGPRDPTPMSIRVSPVHPVHPAIPVIPVIPVKGVRPRRSEPGHTRLSQDDGSMASKLPQT